jgi:hypothetical protein
VREEYRQHARECLNAAKLAIRPDVKAILVATADRWIELAERMKARFRRFMAGRVVNEADQLSCHYLLAI